MKVTKVNLYDVRHPNTETAVVAAPDQTAALDVFMMEHSDVERDVCSVFYNGTALMADFC